ncbi:hypothetical protein GIB67_037619 [Kingdonia uniflora]|uniref:Uncharacterized protein n=1 Tax=Kingdonia uniflora TaxID=39325 RepID=A0A7J7LSF4_9MAGN|nr:hypothetical protein GIB67_037619 [Kingdonia uniflora]
MISFDENAQPIGENGAKFVSNIGGLMRTHCPIFYEFWRFVPDHQKETIWKNVTDEYDVPTYMKGKVLARAQQLWCDLNSKYQKFNYYPYPNDERKKNPKVPIFRTDVYLATHTRADGSSLTPELDVELAIESPSSMHPSSPIALLGKERPCELLSFTGKIVASGRAIGDLHSAVYNIIIDDVTYNLDIDSVDSDPSLSSLNDVELGTTIVWAKMLTRFFN